MNDSPAPTLLHQLRTISRIAPEHVAIVQSVASITYGELWRGIEHVGIVLRQHASPNEHVALVMDNCADYPIAVYGAWAAQAVVVGLNTSLKEEDLLWQIAHCGARVLIVGDKYDSLAQSASARGIKVLRQHELSASATDAATSTSTPTSTRDAALNEPHAAAAIIYTSGTTGQPKGVVLTHDNLMANTSAIQQSLPMRGTDVTLCLLPFFYAYGFSVLNTHLTLGATLVLENSLMYPQHVLQRMTDWRATAFYGVPSTYYLLLERGHLERADLGTLRYCAQAGGAMDPERIDHFCTLMPHVAFYVMYGQSEASSRLTTLPSEERSARRGSVGRPIAGIELSIRSADGQSLPAGTVGEVCAKGRNVMSGYWAAEQDSAQTLRDGWLWSGDLGYLDADGFLYLTGRSRELIKTGAHRVSPWEIEQAIQAIAGVREAAVLGMPDHLLGEVVHACVIADEPSDALRRSILQACKARLAPYKVPRHIDFVAAFPRTASGKVQKHLLAQQLHTDPKGKAPTP